MTESPAKYKALLVIAPRDYEDVELGKAIIALSQRSFQVTIASKEKEVCTGLSGYVKEATIACRDVDASEFDRVAFIGGPGMTAMCKDVEALDLARRFVRLGKVVGGIGHGTSVLANSGALRDKCATRFTGSMAPIFGDQDEIEMLIHGGGTLVDDAVVVDGTMVTGSDAEAAEAFAAAFAQCQP